MDVPVFKILFDDADAKLLLGDNPMRVTPWDEAPQNIDKPYVTYTLFNGDPQNTMNTVPKVDNLGTQVDVWAPTGAECLAVAKVVRDALEPHGHMTSISNTQKDLATKLYRLRMDFDFFTFR